MVGREGRGGLDGEGRGGLDGEGSEGDQLTSALIRAVGDSPLAPETGKTTVVDPVAAR